MNFELLNFDLENADIQIIDNIKNNQIYYFIKVLKQLEKDPDKDYDKEEHSTCLEYFKSYLLLYLADSELWTNPYDCIFADQDNFKYFIQLIDQYIDEEDREPIIVNTIENLFNISMDFLERNNFFSKLLDSKSVFNHVLNHDNNEFGEHFLNNIRWDIDLSKSKAKISISIKNIIDKFLNVQGYSFIIDYFYKLLASLKNKFKLENITYKTDMLYSSIILRNEIFTMSIINCLICHFTEVCNHKKVKMISSKILFEENNLFKDLPELELKTNEKSKFGYLTQIFYIINRLTDICYYKLLKEIEYREKELVDYEMEISMDDLLDPDQVLRNIMAKNLHGLCGKRIDEISLLFNILTLTKLKDYEKLMITYMTNIEEKPHHFIDDMLSNLLEETMRDNAHKLKFDHLNLIYKIFKNNGLTKNPHLKCQYLKIFQQYSNTIIEYDSKELFFNDIFKKVIAELPNLVMSINNGSSSGELYDSIFPSYSISCIFNHLVFPNKIFFDDLFNNLKTDFLKQFINVFIDQFQQTMNEGLNSICKLSELEKNPLDDDEYEINLVNNTSSSKYNMSCNLEFLSLILKLTNIYKEAFMTNEIRNSFCQNIIYYLERLVGKDRKKYKVKSPDKIAFYPIIILEKLKNIICNFNDNEEFIKCVSRDDRSFKDNLIEQMISILYCKDKITNIEDIVLCKLNEKIVLERKKYEDLYDEIPDELCDPIMNTLIEEPVMLPDMEIIMDKNVIERHLINDPHNPFNREELSMQDIEEFNKKNEVIEKINEFKIKIDKFKSK